MSDTVPAVDGARLRELLARATPGPWAVRPQEHDDWGVIRTTVETDDGWHPAVALARDVGYQDHGLHRARHTDPTEGNADLIVAAVNALPALLDERDALAARVKALEEGLRPFAKLAGPINGEVGRPTYIEAISGPNGTDEMLLTSFAGDGRRQEIVNAEDFRAAHALLSKDATDA